MKEVLELAGSPFGLSMYDAVGWAIAIATYASLIGASVVVAMRDRTVLGRGYYFHEVVARLILQLATFCAAAVAIFVAVSALAVFAIWAWPVAVGIAVAALVAACVLSVLRKHRDLRERKG